MNDDAYRAFEQICVKALARREYSRAELASKAPDFCDSQTIGAVLDALAAKGWQSDERFCEQFVRAKSARGDGPIKVKLALRQRGISDNLLNSALEAVDWFAVARRAYAKKYAQAVDSPQERAKRQRFLAQRGFSFEQIDAAMTHDNFA